MANENLVMGGDSQAQLQPNRRIAVKITEDNMCAYVRLPKPYMGEPDYTYDELKAALTENGIKMGIMEDKLRFLVEEKLYNSTELVAAGKRSEDGHDGEYKLFFDCNVDGKPKINEDGTVDYYNLKLFEIVNEGDKLAEYIPPTKGSFGFDVKGKLLVPKNGKSLMPLRGKGFTVSEDGNIYYAATDGKVEFKNNDLNVYNILAIHGDVDMNVGNINFNGDVEITGNVISGISIYAKGNITIGGHVESAVISAGGDIVFKDGVNGKGQARIEAGGSICAKFLENLTARANGDVMANYLLNCNIVANSKVLITGRQGSIQGGDVTGVRGIDVDNAGVEAGFPTVLRVGITNALSEEYTNILRKLSELNKELEAFEEIMLKYDNIKKVAPEKFDREIYARVFQTKIVKSSERAKYNMRGQELFYLINEAEKSVIKVRRRIYPGTKLVLNNMVYEPNCAFSQLLFKIAGGKVVMCGLDDDM